MLLTGGFQHGLRALMSATPRRLRAMTGGIKAFDPRRSRLPQRRLRCGDQGLRRGFLSPSTTLGIDVASSMLVVLHRTFGLVALATVTGKVGVADTTYVLCHGDIQADW